MKSLSVLALCPLALFCADIYFEKDFAIKLEPRKMVTSVIFGMESKAQSEIKASFDKLLSELKESQSACKGGEFSIAPQYDYKVIPPKFINYSGKMGFECLFEDITEYDKALVVFEKNLTQNHKIAYTPIIWQLEEKEVEAAKDRLRTDAIIYALQYKKEIERQTQMRCAIKEVRSNHGYALMPRGMEMDAMRTKSISSEEPIKSDKSISIKASYIFSCLEGNTTN